MSQVAIVYLRLRENDEYWEINEFLDDLIKKTSQQYDFESGGANVKKNKQGIICILDHYPSYIEKNQARFSDSDIEKLCEKYEGKRPNCLIAFEYEPESEKKDDKPVKYAEDLIEYLVKEKIPMTFLIQTGKVIKHNYDDQ